MKLLTNEQMRAADAYTIKELGVPSLTLMERAGTALYLQAKTVTKGKILVVCGGGNNGGDGFVCARKLLQDGYPVTVALLGEARTAECVENRKLYEAQGGVVWTIFPEGEYSLVVDCLFGTGFSPRGGESEIFERINAYKKSGAKILSADVPSGLCDDGAAPSGAVKADCTVCFGEMKLCTQLEDGLDYSGTAYRVDIGIDLPEEDDAYAQSVSLALVKSWLPARKRNTHKGTYGRAAIVGGSQKYTGAAYLALSACVRGGAGYSSLYLPQLILPAFYLKIPEALLIGCHENFVEADYLPLLQADAVGFGVGATTEEKTKEILRFLLKNYEGKLVIDADGLNALSALDEAERDFLLSSKKCGVILTPHKKEFSRLTKKSVTEIIKNALDISKAYAKKHDVTVLLKGASTIVTDGDKSYVSTTGTAGQAKGGSGDVLTGLLTSLLATGQTVTEGGALAAYLAGAAAELACEKIGDYALTASDVVSSLGRAFLEIQR
ncbi:MAG: NAD(P)H-hydrate dehydratase [Clostridia bacterium]|nr:NAD(P)H-hydrate dehydratase [Clostridia bacterium]